MNAANQSSFPQRSALTVAVLGCVAALAFALSPAALTQSRIIAPQRPANSNSSTKRPPVATLRASDSAEGSRVALTANQPLSDYEAYRRGDRFYVRIPAADVPRPEAVRGRAFGDVKVQRGAKDTVVSFRLQPGATARVEQRGNKLDVVFTMPGAREGGSSSSARVSNTAVPAPPPVEDQRRAGGNTNSSRGADRSGNRNSGDRTSAAARATPTPRATPSPKPSPTPSPRSSPSPTASAARGLSAAAQQRSSPSPTASAGAAPTTAQGSTWNNFKQRVRYWILLAQLNPVPVAVGVAVLLLLIGLAIMQLRRAKATRRSRFRTPPKRAAAVKQETPVAPVAAAVAEPAEVEPAVAAAPVAVAALSTDEAEPRPAPTDAQHARVTQASEEVKKLMAGGDYDTNIIASDDKYTRQLVGAELLSALVGRNLQRRERARAAFMNHGYFDDATRDLRIAESANERAAAARRLSFVHDREATPHLMAALEDSSPDVRRAAVEALMDLRDRAAIAALNSLMQTETDRRVPRSLIKHAIEACATSASDEPAMPRPVSSLPEPAAPPMSQAAETEREVIEI